MRSYHVQPLSAFRRAASAVVALALATGACSADERELSQRRATPRPPSVGAEQSASGDDARRVYPAARWRLAREQLSLVMVRLSHIAIRHQSSQPDSKLRVPGWAPDPLPSRSRREALHLADRLAKALRRNSERFGEFARRYSDDVVSAEMDGALGVVPASQLPDEFLDAIAQLKPNEVSQPFESAFGVHLIKLERPPALQKLAGVRIVVAYRGAQSVFRKGHEPRRSRTAALARARQIARKARQPGSKFAHLIRRFGDTVDAESGGDFGVWSSHTPERRGAVLETLARVAVGEVTAPVDSEEGFQVLMRVQATEREPFAATYIALAHFTPEEQQDARAQIARIAEAVRASPDRFHEFQTKHCCRQPLRWTRGRGLGAEVDAAIKKLAVNQTTIAPVEAPNAFLLLKRLDPNSVEHEQATVRWTLPEPAAADLAALLPHTSTSGLKESLRLLQDYIASLGLAPPQRSAALPLLERTRQDLLKAAPQARPAVLARFWRDLERSLPAEQSRLVRAHILNFANRILMEE